jgi:MFS family permease
MTTAGDELPARGAGRAATHAPRTLAVAGLAHALHDGYTDVIYVLLPVWQAEFALGYGRLATLRGLYAGAMALLQVPSGRLAGILGGRTVLAAGTALAALGYALAGAAGGILGLSAALVVAGAGGSTQHPIGSGAVSRAYGVGARGPLGIYNFSGDLGKAAVPAAMSLVIAATTWRHALWGLSGLGLLVAGAVLALMPGREPDAGAVHAAAHADGTTGADDGWASVCSSPSACSTPPSGWGCSPSSPSCCARRARRCPPWDWGSGSSSSAARRERPPAGGSANAWASSARCS